MIEKGIKTPRNNNRGFAVLRQKQKHAKFNATGAKSV